MEARVSEEEITKLAEALKQALLSDHSGYAYMRDDDPLDRFLIDGEVDLLYIARKLAAAIASGEHEVKK